MPGRTVNARQQRVFDSVFGSDSISQPTPVATPATGFTPSGQVFGAPPPASHRNSSIPLADIRDQPPPPPRGISSFLSNHVDDQVRWDRSWHMVTRHLHLPDFPENRGILEPLQPERGSLGPEFFDALEDVLYPQECVPLARQTEDIVAWHTSQVRQHFLQQVLPIILRLSSQLDPGALLLRGVKILGTAHRQYLHGLSFIKEQIDNSTPETSQPIIAKFRRDLHAIISNTAIDPLSGALRKILRWQVSTILGLPSKNGSNIHNIAAESQESEKARREILGLVESLNNVGLTGERFQVIFAEIMNDSMTEYVSRGCNGLWPPRDHTATPQLKDGLSFGAETGSLLPRIAHHSSPSQCVTDLCEWIENRYAKLAVQVLSMLDNKVIVSWIDMEKFKEMSIDRLANLRINELFDIVVNWPRSSGALDDLRTAITTAQKRLHLTDVFSHALGDNLLHPGASTILILQTYISMIRSFHALDHSKVLLDRVAYALQLYLCSREDTVRIIIAGLLSETEDAQAEPISPVGDKLVELAHLLNDGSEKLGQRANDEDLDWHDLEWIPDPVDAGPGYKRSKTADVIGTLIGVLGSPEVFIKEFQNIIGENFLKHDGGFEKEIKVLDLLKSRFGEAPMQACEVMLKDIQDSGRVDGVVRRNQNLDPSGEEVNAARANPDMLEEIVNPEGLLKPSLHAKILSRLYWPQLQDENYRIPEAITELQKRYEEGFESLKASRKLTWLHTLGQATVELELEDRTVTEGVHTWQATVIWAFQSGEQGNVIVERTVQDLVQDLEMEEMLVRNALKFWVNKLILQEVSPDRFAVMETLTQEDRARSKAQATASSMPSGNDEIVDDTGMAANEGIGEEKLGMYWQFIQGMLTNSSPAMALQQIVMMLKMLIVDGFPYSNEELQEFLARKVAEGSLELVGGKYRLKR